MRCQLLSDGGVYSRSYSVVILLSFPFKPVQSMVRDNEIWTRLEYQVEGEAATICTITKIRAQLLEDTAYVLGSNQD